MTYFLARLESTPAFKLIKMNKQERKDITVQQVLEQRLAASDKDLNSVQAVRITFKHPEANSSATNFYHREAGIFLLDNLLRQPWAGIRAEVVKIVLHFDRYEEKPGDLTFDADQLSVHHF